MSDSVPDHDVPTGDEPGASSTPGDEGKGTVHLSDRLAGGAPDTNQGKAESLPPTPSHATPEPAMEPGTGVDLGDMNVGAGDPQAPSHAQAGPRPDHSSSYGAAPVAEGSAQKARGSQGASPEPVDTDVDASTAVMSPAPLENATPGDAHGVPVPSHDAADGSSESAPIVQGARTPVE